MRLAGLQVWGIFAVALSVIYAAPTIKEEDSSDSHAKLESFEFNHPSILPQHPDNFKNDKIEAKRSQSLYVTKTRLPPNLLAVSYQLWFQPYFPSPGVTYPSEKNFTFDATVSLEVEALVTSDRFILNAYNLNIKSVQVSSFNGDVPIISTSQDNTTQQLSLITNPNGVLAGTIYTISIVYSGVINPYTVGGVYYTSYNDPQGATHYMIATHMEPFSARLVFPSLDEPSYKASFTISLTYPSAHVALSNMMEPAATDIGDGWSTMKFKETPQMSSYLIAFAVGPYVSASFINQHNTLTRAWGWPGTEQYLQFAAENAGHCLYRLGEYTGIRFPLTKADQLGMPEFLAGAMENWGLIIYKYQYIAYNPTTMTTRDMQAAAKVMCHELAHQWFGDLVTTAWWDDLFLNEGFADYFMTFIQKFVYPTQATYLDTIQVLNELQVGLNADIRSDAHPVVYPNGPAFDDITYNKGASMLRMLSDVLGANVFQQGIQAYLQNRAYKNARDIDLTSTLTTVAASNNVLDWCGRPLNVTDFMAPYLYQTNFPLIRYNNNQRTGGSYFTQEPFGSTANLNSTTWGYKWTVPLSTSSLRHPDVYKQWLPATACVGVAEQEDEPKKRAVQWEYTSVTSATYGRIIYDDIGFDRVIQNIQQNDISDNVKLQLLSDEYYYMNREKAANRPFGYDRFLNLAKVIFTTDSSVFFPSYSVFAQAQSVLEEVSKNFRDTIDYEMVPRLYKKLFQKTYTQLQWNDTSVWNIDTFSEVFLPFAVRYDIGDVENRTMNMFANVKAACADSLNGTAWCNPYPTNVRKAVYCGAAKFAPATSDFFFRMLHAYNQEVVTNPYFYQEYMALLEGMSCTQQSATLKTLIRLFVNSPLDPNRLFGFLKYNPVASDALYNYLVANPQIVNSPVLNVYLDAMTYNWNTYSRNTQFAELMNSLELTDGQFQIFDNYLQRVGSQMSYRTTFGIKLWQWMYDNLVVIGKTPWEKSLKQDVNFPTYKVEITPFIPGSGQYQWYQNMTFSASLSITFNIIKPTSVITINAHRLMFSPTDIGILSKNLDGTYAYIPIDLKNVKKDYDRGVLTIPTQNATILYPNEYTLRFDYLGFIFQNPNEGPASNTYFGGLNGKKGWIFTTDFEGGPGARSLLPCWDEPMYKGQFVVTVMHPTDMIALSNSQEISTMIYNNGWSSTTFQTTDQMSSYLLAICVGHFANLAKVSKFGTLTRMWTWAGMEQYGELALNVTVGTMEFMSDYFRYDYPLTKLDVMALPEYTQDAGAMENFGLIIGEYSLFMVDPDYATTLDIAEVAETAAHEVVHQWFGDTVTLDWWNDIFLNEGFAQFWFANGINRTFPEQEGYAIDYNRFYMNYIALRYDCIHGYAKPVISDTPPVFGIEPYYKGSALLNLLNNVLTPPVFQQGLTAYLTQYGFENASPQQLWDALTQAASANGITDWNGERLIVSSFMNQYTLQTSYPIITLTLRGTSTVQATQQSCMGGDNLWNVPLFTQTQDSTTFNWFVNQTGGNDSIWLRPLPSNFRVDNAGSTSFARINYDDKSWYSIQAQLLSNYKSLSATSRAMLFDDARFFFESGRWDMTKFLDLTLYLVNEDSLAPWEQAIGFFTNMLNRFQYQQSLATVQNYVIQITKTAHNNLQFDTYGIWTNDRMVQLLVNLNDLAVNRQTRLVSQTMFTDFINRCQFSKSGTGTCSGIHPNLRASTYCYGLLQSNKDSDFITIQNLYQWFVDNAGYLQTDGANLLNALGCSQNKDLIKLLLDDIMMGDYPPSLLRSIALRDSTASILFQYLTDNTVKVLFAPFDFSIYLNAMFNNWSTDVLYSMGANFEFTTNWELLTLPQQHAYRNGLSGVQDNINWMNSYGTVFVQWIQKNFGAVNV